MADTVRSTRDEESRKRDDVAAYQVQQQMDELRRQLRELVARQQWLEDLYKHSEGQLVQLQMLQERHTQDVAQTLQARQIEDARVKQQVSELTQRVDEPLKPIRELRAQITELADSRRQDRDRTADDNRQVEALQGQIRQLTSQLGLLADGQRQLRDLVQELDSVNNETRQEAQRIAEAQRLEDQRLRRQGVELQQMVEGLRTEFVAIAARSSRVDDVRRQLLEHIEGIQAQLGDRVDQYSSVSATLQRLEQEVIENHDALQERVESLRTSISADLIDLRQIGDQRMERYIGRFQQLEERIRELDQRLIEIQPQFEAGRRRDEELEIAIDGIEERHLRDELSSIESQLEALRQRRAKKQAAAAQKAALVRNVREARPHTAAPELPPPEGAPQ